jgi:hypothetical protein
MAGRRATTRAAIKRPARRLFSPDEADRALVLVRRIVADIIRDYGHLSDLQESLENAQQIGMYDRAEVERDRIIAAVERIQACARELESIGAELEDWTLGVVGFPCIAGSRQVMLCWRPEDRGVAYWHDMDEDCALRRPIDTLPAETSRRRVSASA